MIEFFYSFVERKEYFGAATITNFPFYFPPPRYIVGESAVNRGLDAEPTQPRGTAFRSECTTRRLLPRGNGVGAA